MKTNSINIIQRIMASTLVLAFLGVGSVKAETIFLTVGNYTLNGAPSGSEFLSARFGVWDNVNQTFTQALVSIDHAGYVATPLNADFPDWQVSLNQTDNTIIPSTTLLALAIFSNGSVNAGPLEYSPSYNFRAILTDSSWVAGSFSNNTEERLFTVSANTVAAVGSFSFSGGAATVGLIPEPSSASLLVAGLGLLAAVNRRKKS